MWHPQSGVAPKLYEKGVALKVGEKAASHLTPLHAPEFSSPSNLELEQILLLL